MTLNQFNDKYPNRFNAETTVKFRFRLRKFKKTKEDCVFIFNKNNEIYYSMRYNLIEINFLCFSIKTDDVSKSTILFTWY